MIPKLRWFVVKKEWETWNSRYDEYVNQSMETNPVLQYQDENGEWVKVPTVTEVIKGDSHGTRT